MDLSEAQSRGFVAGARHPWERARLALATRLLASHAPLRPGDVVLDIGCGDTFVVESLARMYPAVSFHAVDSAFTPELIALYSRQLTVPNVSLFASLEAVPSGKAASVVLLMDVLEHVEDDGGLLQNLSEGPYFGPETRVLITVPAYPGLFCSHDRFLKHYRRYSKHSFQRLISNAGLSPVVSGHLFASLVAARVLQVGNERLSKPVHDSATGLATWSGGEWLARFLAAVLHWDGRVALALLRLGISLPGLSCFAVCRTSA